MIKLRKALLSNYLYFIIIFLTLINVYIKVNQLTIKPYSKKYFTGYITDKTDKYLTVKNKYKIIVYNPNINKLELGDNIKITGDFLLPNSNRNLNSFNYKNFLLSKKIYYISYQNKIEHLNKNTNIFYHIKNYFIKRINHLPNKAYLYAFILGTGKYIKPNITESYRYNGLSHLLAISGAQVSLFAGFILFIFRKRSEKSMYLMAILTTILITFLAGFTPSMNRAMIAFILISINIIYYFHIKNIHLWLLTISINLLLNPFDIYNIGFWYSYLITCFLILKKDYPKGLIKNAITISWLSFLASLPITLSTFYIINPMSILYNLFYVPYVSFIIYPGILLSFIFKPIGYLIKPFIIFFEHSSMLLSNLKLINITSGHIPTLIIIIIYVFLLIYIKYNQKSWLIIISIILIANNYYLNNQDYIYFIDIGQGDSTFIKYQNKHILIDTGENNGYNHLTILNFLKSINVKTIDYLILTHGDSDHIGNAKTLLKLISVKKIVLNTGNNNQIETFIKNRYPNRITTKTSLKWLKIMYLRDNSNENDNSISVLININQIKLLMMGDLTSKYEDLLINQYHIKDIDHLKLSHHGSKYSTSNYLLRRLNPKSVIISVGLNNRFEHPNKELLERLNNIPIYRTDLHGMIKLKLKANSLIEQTIKD